MRLAFCVLSLTLCLSACGTYAVSVVKPPSFDPKATVSREAPKKDAALVVVSDDDITDRPYRVLGDIEIHVNK